MQTRGFKLNPSSAFQSTEEGLSLKHVHVVYLLYLPPKIVFFSLINQFPYNLPTWTCTLHDNCSINYHSTCIIENDLSFCVFRL